jgi:hypothetical protein
MADGGLARALEQALAPRGLTERLRHKVSPGYTAAQVVGRLPASDRAVLAAAHRHPAEAVHAALLGLVSSGRVRTRRVRYTVVLNTKGHRDMVVDVFWRA